MNLTKLKSFFSFSCFWADPTTIATGNRVRCNFCNRYMRVTISDIESHYSTCTHAPNGFSEKLIRLIKEREKELLRLIKERKNED